jgi:hypothetical protein
MAGMPEVNPGMSLAMSKFDFVITLCDVASCPVWPGQPSIAHWETPLPSDVEGTEKQEDAVWKVTQQIKTDPALLLKPRTRSNRQDYSEQH